MKRAAIRRFYRASRLAIDGYTDRIIANGAELPTDTDLLDFASDAISDAGK